MNLPTIPNSKIKGNLGESLTTLLLGSFAIPLSTTQTDIGIDIQGELIKDSRSTGRTFRMQIKFWKTKPYPSKQTQNYWNLLNEPVFLFWIQDENTKPSFSNTVNAKRYYKKYASKFNAYKDHDFKDYDENKFVEEINKYWDEFDKKINNGDSKSITPKKTLNSKNIKKINNHNNLNDLEILFKKILGDNNLKKPIDNFSKIRLYLFSVSQLYKDQIPSEILNNHEINLIYKYKDKIKLISPEPALIARTLLSDNYNHKPGWYWLSFNNKTTDFISIISYFIQNDLSEDVVLGCLNFIDEIWPSNAINILEQSKQIYNDNIKIKELNILLNHPCEDTQNICKKYLNDSSEDVRKKAVEVYTTLITKISPHLALSLFNDDKNYDKYKISPEFYSQLDETDLRTLESHSEGSIRFNAIKQLIKNNSATIAELKSLLSDENWNIKFIVIKELLKKGEQFSIDQIKEKLKWDGKNISELFSRRLYGFDEDELIKQKYEELNSEELNQLLKWDFDGPKIYEVLNSRDQTLIENIRTDLWDNFNKRRNELLTKEANEKGVLFPILEQVWKDYDKTLKNLFIRSGLKVLSNKGNTQDIKIALKYINGTDYEITSTCKEIIFNYSTSKETSLLIDLAQKDKSPKYALRAIELNIKKNEIVNQLLNSNEITCITTALAYIYKNNIMVNLNILTKLLYLEDDNIRKYIVVYLCKFNTKTSNIKILKGYSAKESYYYNVVSIFDKLIFSPTFIRKININKFEKELLNMVY